MLNSTRVERLEQVIRVLRELPKHEREEHFDMEEWGKLTHCGTTSCALGFAASDIWFRKKGFRMEFHLAQVEKDLAARVSVTAELHYRGSNNWCAVENFFGLSFDEASDLFRHPKTIPEVITAIRRKIRKLS